jgi:hypothetical protein
MARPPVYHDGLFEPNLDPLRIRRTIPLNMNKKYTRYLPRHARAVILDITYLSAQVVLQDITKKCTRNKPRHIRVVIPDIIYCTCTSCHSTDKQGMYRTTHQPRHAREDVGIRQYLLTRIVDREAETSHQCTVLRMEYTENKLNAEYE